MRGLLGTEFDDPKTQGLLSLGLALLNGRGNLGQALSDAGSHGMAAYNAARDAKDSRETRALQRKQLEGQLSLQAEQIAQARIEAEQRRRMQELAQQSMRPGVAPQSLPSIMSGSGERTPEQNASLQQAVNAASAPTFDWAGYTQGLAAIDPARALQMQAMLKKEAPKLKNIEVMRDPQTNLPRNVAVFEDGTTKVLPYGVRPDIALQSLGNRVVAVDKNSTNGGQSFDMGVSPDAQLGANVSMRGQNLVDARAREANARAAEANALTRAGQATQLFETPNGPVIVSRATGEARPVTMAGTGEAIPGESSMKRVSGARRVLSLLDDAEKLVNTATGSYAGAAVDAAARAFGAAPAGAVAIGQLKALEGSLLAEMPRMEGPQSNADVQMYKQAAGDLGDPTAPRAVKLAAIQTIRGIQNRYAGNAPAPSDPAGGNVDALLRKYGGR